MQQDGDGAVGKPLVLIAEDEPDNQAILQTVVETLVGARCNVVGDGRAVFDSVRAEAPGVILLDLMMPAMDGFEVARGLKADPSTRSIPIVAVSALVRPRDREEALAAGCDEFVRKPFEIDGLEALIRKYLGLPRGSGAGAESSPGNGPQ